MSNIAVHTPAPHPGPGQRDPDLISKSVQWLIQNAKRGIRRDEGGRDLVQAQLDDMNASGFFSMTPLEQAAWIQSQKKELIDSCHKRVDPYLDEMEMRAVGR